MKILVCVKQVPDMESKFAVNSAGTWIDSSDLAWRMNEYDEYAVEQAVRLKEQVGEADITILSIGPDRVVETIKKALAMGGDRGIHVKDELSHDKDPFQIATLIAGVAREQNFDVLFFGMQSQDRGSAQVGVLVGDMLKMAVVTTVVEFAFEDGRITVKRELEGGKRAKVRLGLPAAVTCQLGLNTPRYPTLPNIMKAKKKELTVVEVATLAPAEALVRTRNMYPPSKKGGGLVLEGDAAELADKLVGILKEKTTVLK